MENRTEELAAYLEDVDEDVEDEEFTQNLFGLFPVFFLFLLVCLRVFCVLCRNQGQKTRSSPPRRMYGSRTRDSLQSEPTIFVSPNNLPPPPKYDALAPPSYEEVVGIHYPHYLQQPITLPLTTAMAQGSAQPGLVTSPNVTRQDSPPYETVAAVVSTVVVDESRPTSEPKRPSVETISEHNRTFSQDKRPDEERRMSGNVSSS